MELKTLHYAIYITLSDGTVIVSPPARLFTTCEGIVKRADRLTPYDQLADANSNPVSITAIVAGKYHGPAEYLLETTPALESIPTDVKMPQVGSDEYSALYRERLKDETMLGVSAMLDEIRVGSGGVFEPYKPIEPSKDAAFFIPDQMAEAMPGTLAALDAVHLLEEGERVVAMYKAQFPDIDYRIDWLNRVVNSFSDVVAGVRRVVVRGALLRSRFLGPESWGLILAHETGHHHGGTPRYPEKPWLTCEGQADYWATSVAQKKVWTTQAVPLTQKAITQIHDAFAHGLLAGNLLAAVPANPPSCAHPVASCRLATFTAGLNGAAKPACAS